MPLMTRRRALGIVALAPGGLAGCAILPDLAGFEGGASGSREGAGPVRTPDYAKVYAAVPREPHPVPAFDFVNTDPTFLRADVAYGGPEPAGTVVVQPKRHVLYLVEAGGRATRYGIAVGREATGFAGTAAVAARKSWPDWEPSAAVAARGRVAWAQLDGRPLLLRVPGGPKSPRGARALFLAVGDQDAGFVLHGTPDPDTVGQDVPVGCIALVNQDVIDLYGRVAEGTPVVVIA